MIGRKVGRYRIVDKIGEGGMGIVYRATDTQQNQIVAIKALPPHLTGKEEQVLRLRREASAAGSLDHPNICPVFEILEEEEMTCIVMPFLLGFPLSEKLQSGPLPIQEALNIVFQVCSGLNEAHENGVIHRDIKSENVMLTDDGLAVIMDFGLAQIVSDSKLTMSSSTMGTAAYMSPEQVRGDWLDARTDIWSLGIVFYECLTGVIPFERDTETSLMYSILNKSIPPPSEIQPDIPSEVERVVFKCLSKSLADRYQSTNDVLGALDSLRRAGDDSKTADLDAVDQAAIEQPPDETPVIELDSTAYKLEHKDELNLAQTFSEIVGRDNELEKLTLFLHKVIAGEGAVLNVIGEPGIGKTRLIEEFARIESIKNVTLLEGKALSIGRNLSYHPIIDILKNWSGITEQDSESESFRKLEKAIQRLNHRDAAELFPFIALLMGMRLPEHYAERVSGIEGEALEKLILQSIREIIIKGSSLSPIVFVVQDLHWADTSSVSLLESLFRLAERHPVLFINVFRPGYPDTSERILETIHIRYGHITRDIILDPLDVDQSQLLIQNLLKSHECPGSLCERISNRAEGNPFFIEEVVRSLRDQGLIVYRGGSLKVAEDIDSVVIPDSIQDVLLARIKRLDDRTNSLLKEASVIGRYFFHRILASITSLTEEIDSRLKHLEDIELISERTRIDELEYLFRHALTQEATYSTIGLPQRRELHLRVARAIESIFEEKIYEFYGMLALHYSLGEDYEKAEEYLLLAGQEAMRSSASHEALHYFKEALELYMSEHGEEADPSRIAMMEKGIALAYYNKGQYREAVSLFDKTLLFSRKGIPKNRILLFISFISGFIHFLISIYLPRLKWKRVPGENDLEYIDLFYKKLLAMGHVDPRRVFIESFFLIQFFTRFDMASTQHGICLFCGASLAFSWTGMSFRLSRTILSYLEDKLDRDDVKSAVYFETVKVTHNFFEGTWQDVEYDHSLSDRALKAAEIFYISNYTIFHGRTYLEQGRLRDAIEMADMLTRISDRFDHDYPMALKYFLRTKILMKDRRLVEALTEAEEGLEFLQGMGLGTLSYGLPSLKARIHILMDDHESAISCLQQAEALRSEINVTPCYLSEYLMSSFLLHLTRLKALIRSEDGIPARKDFQKLLHIGKKTVKNAMKVASDQTESYKMMGLCYWLKGDIEKALKWWMNSIQTGQKLGANLELSRVFYEVGRNLQTINSRAPTVNGYSAEDCIKLAGEMFENLHLQHDLDLLEIEMM